MIMRSRTIVPSPEARRFFNKMVAKDDGEGHLDVGAALELAVEVRRDGQRDDTQAVRELQRAGWIEPAGDGGWFLGEGNPLHAD
jgi:hypothetical protein